MLRYCTHSPDSLDSNRGQNDYPPPSSSIMCSNSTQNPANLPSIVAQNQNSSQHSSPQTQTQAHTPDSLFDTCLKYISTHLAHVESLQHFPQLVAEKLLSRSLPSLSHNTECTLRVLRLFVDAYGVDFMTSFRAFSDGVCHGFGSGIGGLSPSRVSESSLNGMF